MTLFAYLQALALVLLTTFLLYVALILVPFLRHRPGQTGDPDAYEWHFFVPCRNEEAVIGGSLARLRADLPGAHVWVVDDASTDATAAVVEAAAAGDERVHLVRRTPPEAQTGKGDALNAAYRRLVAWLPADVQHDRVIVGVVDADGVLDPAALRYAAGPAVFGDAYVGAAQCQVQMFPTPSGLGRWARTLRDLQDAEFRTTIAAMQVMRGYTLSVGLGGNGQFSRLSALDDIGAQAENPWHGSLLEDYELSLHMMLAGWQTRYLHEGVVTQEAVFTLKALVRQRTRWCQGGMQCVRYLRQAAMSPHITPAGTLELAYFMSTPFQELVGMVVWPAVILGIVGYGLAANPDVGTFVGNVAWILPLVVLTGILPFAAWGVVYGRLRGFGPLRTAGFALTYWLYSYLPQVYVVCALHRLAQGRNGWEKTARHADATTPIGTAPEPPASGPSGGSSGATAAGSPSPGAPAGVDRTGRVERVEQVGRIGPVVAPARAAAPSAPTETIPTPSGASR